MDFFFYAPYLAAILAGFAYGAASNPAVERPMRIKMWIALPVFVALSAFASQLTALDHMRSIIADARFPETWGNWPALIAVWCEDFGVFVLANILMTLAIGIGSIFDRRAAR